MVYFNNRNPQSADYWVYTVYTLDNRILHMVYFNNRNQMDKLKYGIEQ